MKTARIIRLICLFSMAVWIANGQTEPAAFIDPTGTYKLISNTHMEGEDVYGYYGVMRVKLISRNKVVIDWDLNKGAPSYNDGGINDTLVYSSNKSVYRTKEDSTCRINFIFSRSRVTVTEKTADYNWGCGFAHGVVGNGVYKKISGRIPEIDLLH